MTKKQAYKIIEKKYGNYDGTVRIYSLCSYLDYELRSDWCHYWDNINKNGHLFIAEVFDSEEDCKLLGSLARMMFLHYFIEDTYK